jgi:hypothetical protein
MSDQNYIISVNAMIDDLKRRCVVDEISELRELARTQARENDRLQGKIADIAQLPPAGVRYVHKFDVTIDTRYQSNLGTAEGVRNAIEEASASDTIITVEKITDRRHGITDRRRFREFNAPNTLRRSGWGRRHDDSTRPYNLLPKL